MLAGEELAQKAIQSASECKTVFAKFLSPNDTGLTGGHQCGIYIPRSSVSLIFDGLFERGSNRERYASIIWNGDDDLVTDSRFVYYGQGTRNEYRITRFGRGFDLLKPDHTGDLVVICKRNEESYEAFVLSDDSAIQLFLDAFSLAPTETNRLVSTGRDAGQNQEKELLDTFYMEFNGEFPSTKIMAITAEKAERVLSGGVVRQSADEQLVRWIDTEYRLFRHIEERHYEYVTLTPAESLESFVKTGLEITNRRKARAGKSLEHHLAALFTERGISFTPQAETELGNTADFVFPSADAYHDASFPRERLTFLGAKTTCKDRWRQVLDEADRIPQKFLFTLQQGVSPNQLLQMHAHNLTLVVPKAYHSTYPKMDFRGVISLEDFIAIVLEKQLS